MYSTSRTWRVPSRTTPGLARGGVLFELLVALCLFLAFLLPLTTCLCSSARTGIGNAGTLKALLLCRELVEEVRRLALRDFEALESMSASLPPLRELGVVAPCLEDFPVGLGGGTASPSAKTSAGGVKRGRRVGRGLSMRYEVKVESFQGDDDLKQVTVTVFHRIGKTSAWRSVSLSTVLSGRRTP